MYLHVTTTLGNGGIFRQLPGEAYQSSSRQHYLSGTQISVGQQAPFPDQRGQIHSCSSSTVDREIFAVKLFSDSMASPKIKHTKNMRIINDSVVRGGLSKNYLTRKFLARNICNAKYSRITSLCSECTPLESCRTNPDNNRQLVIPLPPSWCLSRGTHWSNNMMFRFVLHVPSNIVLSDIQKTQKGGMQYFNQVQIWSEVPCFIQVLLFI